MQVKVRQHGPHRFGWRKITLTRGKYKAESDLILVRQLLMEPGLPPLDELGSQFAEQLMTKCMSLQSAFCHIWIHH